MLNVPEVHDHFAFRIVIEISDVDDELSPPVLLPLSFFLVVDMRAGIQRHIPEIVVLEAKEINPGGGFEPETFGDPFIQENNKCFHSGSQVNKTDFVDRAVSTCRVEFRGEDLRAGRIEDIQKIDPIAFFGLDDFLDAIAIKIDHVLRTLHEKVSDKAFPGFGVHGKFPGNNLPVVPFVLCGDMGTSEENQAENYPLMQHEFIVT